MYRSCRRQHYVLNRWRLTGTLLVLFTWTTGAAAHEGPPFPIVMDHQLGEYRVSVWTDPDIGEARFFIVLERADADEPPETVPGVALWVEPLNGRLDRVTYEATRQDLRNRLQFAAQPYFDQGDMWNVGVQLTIPGQSPLEVVSQVESTPPGLGPWDLAIYLFPFLMFGGLWIVAIIRRRMGTSRFDDGAVSSANERLPQIRATAPRSDHASAADHSARPIPNSSDTSLSRHKSES